MPAANVAEEAESSTAPVNDGTPASAAPTAPLAIQPPARGIGVGGAASTPLDWRALVNHKGVKFSATEITDASSGTSSMSGAHALRTHSNLELRLDFDSLFGWHGFSAYVQHKTKTGRNGSGEASFVQAFSNIDAEDFRAFGEAWVQQTLFADRLRVRAGRLDFNTEFAGTPVGASFLNAAMGFSPSITAAPTFPLPVAAANVVVSPFEGWTVSAGEFDGRSGAPAVAGQTSRFRIAQTAHEWELGGKTIEGAALSGRASVGAWRHTGLFARVGDGPDAEPTASGTSGWYATVDQTLWRGAPRAAATGESAEEPTRASIAAFAQLGRSDPTVQAVQAHRGGGLTFTGLSSHRASDVLGVAMTNARWVGGRETISEVFYSMPVISHLSLVGDWQHVGRRADALSQTGHVFTLRTILTF